MPTELINILIQLPVVVVFVWYSDHMLKQFKEFLREERDARREQMAAMSTELKELRMEIVNYRETLREAAQSGHDARESKR